MSHRAVLLFPVLALALLGGCAQTGVEPGDGPADTPAVVEGEPGGEPTEEESMAPTGVANFREKVTYPDGVEVEVTRIKTGHFTKSQVEYADGEKAGDPYVIMTIRARNGSGATIDLVGSGTLTYGPDGEEGEQTSLIETSGSMDGKLLPGKAKSETRAYKIPEKWWSDVTLEYAVDFERESAVFTGSIKP